MVVWRMVLAVVMAVGGLALRTRLSVARRRRQWDERARSGELLWVALGDSLTQGIGSSRLATAWLGRVVAAATAHTGHSVRVVNLAVYGARVADVLTLQLPAAVHLEQADVVTVCIGSNDAGRRSAAEFRADLERMCDTLPSGAIVGDVPEFQWGPRVGDAAELSAVVRAVVAARPHLTLAPVEVATTGTRILTELAGDFFHPNDNGYDRVGRAFTPAVLARLGSQRTR
ncbi:MAG: SGNH/GDSL hydrolase family protein [Mycobacteriaceae bacterium]